MNPVHPRVLAPSAVNLPGHWSVGLYDARSFGQGVLQSIGHLRPMLDFDLRQWPESAPDQLPGGAGEVALLVLRIHGPLLSVEAPVVIDWNRPDGSLMYRFTHTLPSNTERLANSWASYTLWSYVGDYSHELERPGMHKVQLSVSAPPHPPVLVEIPFHVTDDLGVTLWSDEAFGPPEPEKPPKPGESERGPLWDAGDFLRDVHKAAPFGFGWLSAPLNIAGRLLQDADEVLVVVNELATDAWSATTGLRRDVDQVLGELGELGDLPEHVAGLAEGAVDRAGAGLRLAAGAVIAQLNELGDSLVAGAGRAFDAGHDALSGVLTDALVTINEARDKVLQAISEALDVDVLMELREKLDSATSTIRRLVDLLDGDDEGVGDQARQLLEQPLWGRRL